MKPISEWVKKGEYLGNISTEKRRIKMKGSNKNFHYKKNTSSNKPKLGYNKNEYIEGVHYYAAVISKEFGLKIMPPVSVVEEIIRDSRQISIFFNNIKINFQIRELIRSNEELLETYL